MTDTEFRRKHKFREIIAKKWLGHSTLLHKNSDPDKLKGDHSYLFHFFWANFLVQIQAPRLADEVTQEGCDLSLFHN